METLKLDEILEGFECQKIYTTYAGTVTVGIINKEYGRIEFLEDDIECVYFDGKIHHTDDATVVVYPSYELYIKYPLDAYSAWMEWENSLKRKRRRTAIGQLFYFINHNRVVEAREDNYDDQCNDLYNTGNYFWTYNEARCALVNEFNSIRYK